MILVVIPGFDSCVQLSKIQKAGIFEPFVQKLWEILEFLTWHASYHFGVVQLPPIFDTKEICLLTTQEAKGIFRVVVSEAN